MIGPSKPGATGPSNSEKDKKNKTIGPSIPNSNHGKSSSNNYGARQGSSAKGFGGPAKLSSEEIEQLKMASKITLDPSKLRLGIESATIRDRINDPGRESWEEFSKNKLIKLREQDRERDAYRKKLDKEREKRLAKAGAGQKTKKKKKKRKRSRSASSDRGYDTDSSDSDDSRKRRRKHKSSSRKHKSKKHKKSKRKHKRRSVSPSPVRLSSYLKHRSSDESD